MSNFLFPTTDPVVFIGVRIPHPEKGQRRSALGVGVTDTVDGVVFLLTYVTSLILPRFIAVSATNSMLIYALPSAKHSLGTDADGHDVLTMVLLGGRDIIIVSVISAAVSTGIAVVLGALAAYLRGWMDSLVIQFTDFILTIPRSALLVVLAIYVRLDSPMMLTLLLEGPGWPGLLRVVRARVLPLKEHEYVEMTCIVGLSTPVIIGREILSNIASYLMTHFISVMTGVTYATVGLCLFGLAPMTGINWGIMVNNAWVKDALLLANAAQLIMALLLVVNVLQLSAIWFARALEQPLNPRLAGK